MDERTSTPKWSHRLCPMATWLCLRIHGLSKICGVSLILAFLEKNHPSQGTNSNRCCSPIFWFCSLSSTSIHQMRRDCSCHRPLLLFAFTAMVLRCSYPFKLQGESHGLGKPSITGYMGRHENVYPPPKGCLHMGRLFDLHPEREPG